MRWQEGSGGLACKWQAQVGSPLCPVLLGPDGGTRGSGQKGPAVVHKKVGWRKGVSGRPPRHSPRCELRQRPRLSPSGRCHTHGGSTAREEDARLRLMLPGGLAGSSWREGHGPRPRGVPSLLPGHTLPELRTSHSLGPVRGWSLGASLWLQALAPSEGLIPARALPAPPEPGTCPAIRHRQLRRPRPYLGIQQVVVGHEDDVGLLL